MIFKIILRNVSFKVFVFPYIQVKQQCSDENENSQKLQLKLFKKCGLGIHLSTA